MNKKGNHFQGYYEPGGSREYKQELRGETTKALISVLPGVFVP